jgi:hypothetical protein
MDRRLWSITRLQFFGPNPQIRTTCTSPTRQRRSPFIQMMRRMSSETGFSEFPRRGLCYCWATMSALNGDKARFNRERKSKLARRERSQVLRKKLESRSLPRATATQL